MRSGSGWHWAVTATPYGVARGRYHSLGLKADGSIVAWGANWSGQCDVPAPNSGFVAVGGGGHSLRLKTPICPGDLDGDGDVDRAGLSVLLAACGLNAGGDLDGDNDTDLSDLALLLANYGCAP